MKAVYFKNQGNIKLKRNRKNLKELYFISSLSLFLPIKLKERVLILSYQILRKENENRKTACMFLVIKKSTFTSIIALNLFLNFIKSLKRYFGRLINGKYELTTLLLFNFGQTYYLAVLNSYSLTIKSLRTYFRSLSLTIRE